MRFLALIITLFVLSNLCHAQDDTYPPKQNTNIGQNRSTVELPDDFYFDSNDRLYFEKVYDSELSSGDIVKHLTAMHGDHYESFDVKNYDIDYASFGYKYLDLPTSISASDLSFHVNLQVKDYKYRLIIRNIVFTSKQTMSPLGDPLSDSDYEQLESSVFKPNGKYRMTSELGLKCLRDSFIQHYDINSVRDIISNEDW